MDPQAVRVYYLQVICDLSNVLVISLNRELILRIIHLHSWLASEGFSVGKLWFSYEISRLLQIQISLFIDEIVKFFAVIEIFVTCLFIANLAVGPWTATGYYLMKSLNINKKNLTCRFK